MIVGVCRISIHLHLPQSLKEKRSVLRRLEARLRRRHNLAVAESEDSRDLWQRLILIVASVNSTRDGLDRLFNAVVSEIEGLIAGEVLDVERTDVSE